MPETARRATAPLITAVVAGVVAVALAVVFFAVVLPNHDDSNTSGHAATTGALTVRERTAMNAAETEAVNLQSFRRAHFEADWARALKGATGALHSDLISRKASTKQVLVSKKIDLAADAQNVALVGPTDSGSGLQVIVTMNGYAVEGQNRQLTAVQRLLLTMVQKNGTWLAADVSQRGLS